MSKAGRRKKRGAGIILEIFLIIAIGVFCFSAYQLYSIYSEYKAASDEYDDLQTKYVSYDPEIDQKAGNNTPVEKDEEKGEKEKSQEAVILHPPVVDFDALKAVNDEVIGWIQMDAAGISYPILQGEDNDYYLHTTTERTYNFAGSIFMECTCKPDFSGCNTIIYGHNMKDGSMFGKLSIYREQEKYDANPFFWICLPGISYRYHIFSVFETGKDSETYTIFEGPGKEFKKWIKTMKGCSEVVPHDVHKVKNKIVTLSTCTADESTRCVVLGILENEVSP